MSTPVSKLNLTQGVTEISQSVFDLHMIIFYICCVIGVIVFGAIIYAVIAFRYNPSRQPKLFHDNLKVEILWTILPIIILIVMAIPATKVLKHMYDPSGEDLLIEVRGYQWKWQYKYLDDSFDETLSFFSNLLTPQEEVLGATNKGEFYLLEVDNPLVIPVGKKVRFLLTSNDVIHAWWVPDFGIKRDAIPGILNELWTVVDKPGVYRGQCTELCGKDHGFMPIVVRALPQEEYDAWYQEKVKAQQERLAIDKMVFTEDQLMVEGEKVYKKYCASCHMVDGSGMPPAFPSLKNAPSISNQIDHIKIVYNGVPGSAMQGFGATGQLTLAEIAQVVHYERHAFGNNAKDVTQPSDVRKVIEMN